MKKERLVKSLRIGFDTHGSQGLESGLGRYCASLLAAWHRRRERPEIHIFAEEHDAAAYGYSTLPNFVWHRSPPWHRRALADIAWHIAELPFLVRDLGLDVLFVHSERRIPPWMTIPTVATVHDVAAQEMPKKYGFASQVWSGRIVPRLLRRSRHLIAVSNTTSQRLQHLIGIPSSRIRTILNGVDAERFRRSPSSPPIAIDPPLILYPGRIEHPAKNHMTAIAAIAILRDRGLHVRLVCAGKDWQRSDEVRAEVARLGLQSQVVFTGFISDTDLVRFYHQASALIFPSRVEGFGLPLVEAMAAELPIISSSSSCMPEIAGPAALYADPDDAVGFANHIFTALTDDAVRKRLIAAGNDRCAIFNWDKTAGETLQALHDAAHGMW